MRWARWRLMPSPAASVATRISTSLSCQPLLQTLLAPAQRLVNGLRRRGQPPLEDGQGEADGPHAAVVLQGFRPVKLLPHVLGDLLVEVRLGVGQLVLHGVSNAHREQRGA